MPYTDNLSRSPLGRTGMEVTPVALGTGAIGGFYEAMDDALAARVIGSALDLGINYIDTSPYYGAAEERIGKALGSRRDETVLVSKAGRYSDTDFDFSPANIRKSLDHSLKLLRTDHLDVFMLHDIEFVPLDGILGESLDTLRQLKQDGKCRAIGVSGYPLKTILRVIREGGVDVVLTYTHGTLLDDSISTQVKPVAEEFGVGLINAAAVCMGLLTPAGARADSSHRASTETKLAAEKMAGICRRHGVDLAFVANQYAIQRSECATTVVGPGQVSFVEDAVAAANTPLDEDLLAELLAVRAPEHARQWESGLKENN